jgi:hypothetical protein
LSPEAKNLTLPTGTGDRILLGCLATPLLLVFGALFLGALLTGGPPAGASGWVLHLLLVDGVFVLASLSGLALVWAIGAPSALGRMVANAAMRAAGLVTLFLAGLLLWMAYVLVRWA